MSYKRVPVPIGTILSWSGGYFSDSSNGSFTSVLGNSISVVNSLLNNSGYYVCDGSALNLSSSPIFNGPNKYLPNLTDDRFLQGATVSGNTGTGLTTLTLSNLPQHSHTWSNTHNHTNTASSSTYTHNHNSFADASATQITGFLGSSTANSLGYYNATTRYLNSATTYLSGDIGATSATPNIGGTSSDSHSHTITVAVNNETISGTTSTTPTSPATSFQNIPKYLSIFYIQRVF